MADVVYIVDKLYFDLFKTSVYSLLDKTSVDINLWVLTKDNEFSEEEKKQIIDYFYKVNNKANINFVTSKLFNSWKDKGLTKRLMWYSDSIFLKCCLHDALPESVDWITYIDSDTLIYRNIDNYLNQVFDRPIAGALDINYDKDTDFAYIAAGVYKTSLKYWRNNNFSEIFESMIPLDYPYVDQDMLNRIFEHNKVVLPLKYCAQHIYDQDLNRIQSLNHALIIHFGGPDKPNLPIERFHSDWYNEWKKYNDKCKDLL